MHLENEVCYCLPWLKYKYARQVFHFEFSMQAYVFEICLFLLSEEIRDKNYTIRFQKD